MAFNKRSKGFYHILQCPKCVEMKSPGYLFYTDGMLFSVDERNCIRHDDIAVVKMSNLRDKAEAEKWMGELA